MIALILKIIQEKKFEFRDGIKLKCTISTWRDKDITKLIFLKTDSGSVRTAGQECYDKTHADKQNLLDVQKKARATKRP